VWKFFFFWLKCNQCRFLLDRIQCLLTGYSYYKWLLLVAMVTRELDAEWWSVGNLLCK
jgi:hypothetical protein